MMSPVAYLQAHARFLSSQIKQTKQPINQPTFVKISHPRWENKMVNRLAFWSSNVGKCHVPGM